MIRTLTLLATLKPRFRRYALTISYIGPNFIGYARQPSDKVPQLLGGGHMVSVHKRLTMALEGFTGMGCRRKGLLEGESLGGSAEGLKIEGEEDGGKWKNLAVSSRTDRGVHAICNTVHVDIIEIETSSNSNSDDTGVAVWHTPERVLKGLNFHLSRPHPQTPALHLAKSTHRSSSPYTCITIDKVPSHLSLKSLQLRPDFSSSPNNSNNTEANTNSNTTNNTNESNANTNTNTNTGNSNSNSLIVTSARYAPNQTWSARYTAVSRTYVYRIICYSNESGNEHSGGSGGSNASSDAGNVYTQQIFESNRALIVQHPLNTSLMRAASKAFVGTHDFGGFRGRKCTRKNGITTVLDVTVDVSDWREGFLGGSDAGGGSFEKSLTHEGNDDNVDSDGGESNNVDELYGGDDGFYGTCINSTSAKLITITIKGERFVYNQVRNMVGALIGIGSRSSPPTTSSTESTDDECECEAVNDIKGMLLAGDKGKALYMKKKIVWKVPAHGLYLVNVEHAS